MESDLKTHDLLDKTDSNSESKTTETTHPLHTLQLEIANMPDIDLERVRIAINKIQQGALDILGTKAEQIACAERIARQIIDESQNS